MDLGRAMERAQVLDWSLQEQLRPHLSQMKPRPSIYIPDFIAANQESRADNVLTGSIAEQVILCLMFLFESLLHMIPFHVASCII